MKYIKIVQISISSHPGSGLTPSTNTLSVRQTRWTVSTADSKDTMSVLTLGQLDVRMCRGPSGHQLDLMVNGTTFTYTQTLLELVLDVREFIRPLLLQTSPGKSTAKKPPSIAIVVSQTRLAWTSGRGLGLALEVREMEATGSSSSHEVSVSGVRMMCINGGEEDMSLVSLQSLVISRKDVDIRITVGQRLKMCWQPSVHILATNCVGEIKQLLSTLSPSQPKPQDDHKKQKIFHLNIQEKLSLQLKIGHHDAKLNFVSMSAKYTGPDSLSWIQSPKGSLKLNKKEIISMEDLVLSAVPKSEKLSRERRRMEGGCLEHNKCFLVAVKSFAFTQPYQFNFYEVVLQEIVGVFKWLKLHHRNPAKPKSSSIPRDILINIQHFKFELADDPFEVKLRDNYVLKEDEYLESQKRLQIFGQKIEELRKKNLMFPKEKIEELLTNLSKKNADIYVARAKELCKVESRTRLFECNLRCVELAILADPSMQGRDHVLDMLVHCDPQSPWPDPASLQFTTLWCRWVKFEAEDISFHLRDFPQHLLDIKQLLLWGKLAGAEVEPGKRATRSHTVNIGHNFDDVIIERGMTPLKFFYDLACDVESWSMAYGLCWEPAITQCSLAMQFLTGNSHDPSPALPWWDKIRLVLHGRLLLAAKKTQLLLHASLDPYNTTEEMDFSFTDMDLEWEEGVIRMNGTLDVYVRTASKYDDFQLLHIPGVSLTVKMEWSCLANPLDHHSVMPCAPDKLPEYSINQEHDSYRAFRSKHLNISVAMETKAGRDRPRMDMFSSTLRWFENLKFIFSGASRPIRRGAQFSNKRPKKPQLSRHFKRVGLSVFLHQFQVQKLTTNN